jgi:hypothetical protein
MLSGRKFVLGCALSRASADGGGARPPSRFPLAAEVFATIIGLFLFGSFKYQIHKNALTYGMLLSSSPRFAALRPRAGTWRSLRADGRPGYAGT